MSEMMPLSQEWREYLIDKICEVYGVSRREIGVPRCSIHRRHPAISKARRKAIAAAVRARLEEVTIT